MWPLLLATAIAASTGLATKLFLTLLNNATDNINHPHANSSASSHDESDSGHDPETRVRNRVFVFNASESPRHGGGSHSRSKLSKNVATVRAPVVEQRGNRLQPFCFNKRETNDRVLVPCSSSQVETSYWGSTLHSSDNSFSAGLGFGIMYMMSAEKDEISKLTGTMKEIAISVQELKSELDIKKSFCVHQISDPNGNIDTNSCKMSGKHYEVMLKKTNSEFRNPNAKIWSPINDGGECGSSALTEEPEPQVLELDQLEAELEFELQKLSGCTVDGPGHELKRPTLDELGVPDEACNGIDDPNFNYLQSPAVLASELNQKLSHLLIKQQEKQIAELESELHRAQSNLQQKEAELHALKDYVKRLIELSLSAVSDDETQVLSDPKGSIDLDKDNMDSFSKQSVGAKRPFDSESCSYCMLNDCDLCEHTIIQGESGVGECTNTGGKSVAAVATTVIAAINQGCVFGSR
ncbi:hypothetical protein RIF29_20320 [Crotalaria pallida]|uniref:Uncharacterized protein n=1 Tax=Crotalaria pallida TaxID=3830 RepID=A0AAN9F1D0_CROPI